MFKNMFYYIDMQINIKQKILLNHFSTNFVVSAISQCSVKSSTSSLSECSVVLRHSKWLHLSLPHCDMWPATQHQQQQQQQQQQQRYFHQSVIVNSVETWQEYQH